MVRCLRRPPCGCVFACACTCVPHHALTLYALFAGEVVSAQTRVSPCPSSPHICAGLSVVALGPEAGGGSCCATRFARNGQWPSFCAAAGVQHGTQRRQCGRARIGWLVAARSRFEGHADVCSREADGRMGDAMSQCATRVARAVCQGSVDTFPAGEAHWSGGQRSGAATFCCVPPVRTLRSQNSKKRLCEGENMSRPTSEGATRAGSFCGEESMDRRALAQTLTTSMCYHAIRTAHA